MARAALKREYAPKSAPVKEQKRTLRVVTDNSKRQSRRPRAADEISGRALFRASVAFMVILVLIGIGPVVVNAEATRASQQSIIIKRDITKAMASLEELELERSMLRSSVRIADIAQNQLGMVPLGEDYLRVEIGSQGELAQMRQQNKVDAGLIPALDAPEEAGMFKNFSALLGDKLEAGFAKDMMVQISELTLGEASTLLVGDISLASWR